MKEVKGRRKDMRDAVTPLGGTMERGREGTPGGQSAPDVIHEGQTEEVHPLG